MAKKVDQRKPKDPGKCNQEYVVRRVDGVPIKRRCGKKKGHWFGHG